MGIALISTGTELLKGSVINTNSAFIGRELARIGVRVKANFTVGDGLRDLCTALADALRISDTIIITGGLGSTSDDISLDAVAKFFGLKLKIDPILEKKITEFWRERHPNKRVPRMMLRQARCPVGAELLENSNGSASGLVIRTGYGNRDRLVIMLPGPPRELEPMMVKQVIPQLEKSAISGLEYTRGFLVLGLGEVAIQQRLEKNLGGLDIDLAYCASPVATKVFISGSDLESAEVATARAHDLLASSALPIGELDLTEHVVSLLKERHLQLATAESCTGGMIASALTNLPGVSAVFKGGVVVYSNELKHQLLGVAWELLNQYGAVSAECARAMIQGAVSRLEVDCAIAVTGIAGPDGGTDTKPVGLVYIGVKCGEKELVREFHFGGDRHSVRERTVANALAMLRELLIA